MIEICFKQLSIHIIFLEKFPFSVHIIKFTNCLYSGQFFFVTLRGKETHVARGGEGIKNKLPPSASQ